MCCILYAQDTWHFPNTIHEFTYLIYTTQSVDITFLLRGYALQLRNNVLFLQPAIVLGILFKRVIYCFVDHCLSFCPFSFGLLYSLSFCL
jgi:hypothetical protein